MKAIYKIPYGLYVLTAKTNKFNGCIINTLIQVTSTPLKISITVNKENYTTEMIDKTGVFNISVLDMNTNFELIKTFGFSSGRNVDKFKSFKNYKLSKNGIPYITENTNAYISAKVVSKTDVGTHVTFVAEITESEVLSDGETLLYSYYLNNIKPKPEVKKGKRYVCRICGYVYEGENLPPDFICPICKHGAEDFEIQEVEKEEEVEINNKNAGEFKYYCPICGNIEDKPSDKCVICGEKMIKFKL